MKRKTPRKLTLNGLVNIFSESEMQTTINFVFSHMDLIINEFSEIYSYEEIDEFINNEEIFYQQPECTKFLYDSSKETNILVIEQLESKYKTGSKYILETILCLIQGITIRKAYDESKFYQLLVEIIDLMFSTQLIDFIFDDFLSIIKDFKNNVIMKSQHKLKLLCRIIITLMSITIDELYKEKKESWRTVLSSKIELLNFIPELIELYSVPQVSENILITEKYLFNIISKSITINLNEFNKLNEINSKTRCSLGLTSKNSGKKHKVSTASMNKFFHECELRHFGYKVDLCNANLVCGFPFPVKKSIEIMKQNLYISSDEIQIKNELDFENYPLTTVPLKIVHEKAFNLFMKIHQYIPGFIKNIIFCLIRNLQVLTKKTTISRFEEMNIKIIQTKTNPFIIDIDKLRESEFICKHISLVLLSILCHFKSAHILMFEYTCLCLLKTNFFDVFKGVLDLELASFKTNLNLKFLDFPWNFDYNKSYIINEQTISDNLNGDFSLIHFLHNILKITKKMIKNNPSRLLIYSKLNPNSQLNNLLLLRIPVINKIIFKIAKQAYSYTNKLCSRKDLFLISNVYKSIKSSLNEDWTLYSTSDSKITSINSTRQCSSNQNIKINLNDSKSLINSDEELRLEHLTKNFIKRNQNLFKTKSGNEKIRITELSEFSSINDLQNFLLESIENLGIDESSFDEWLNNISPDKLEYLILGNVLS